MLSVAEALNVVLQNAAPLPPVATELGPESLGLVLAEDIASDVDMPPFDKAMMDGFAIRAADLRDGKAELAIAEEIAAGQTPRLAVQPGQASRIMTGAPMPKGADAVVMIERCEVVGQRVGIHDSSVKPQTNVLARASEMCDGEVVLRAGARLNPQEFGVLATVGRTSVLAHPRPSVAVLCTGDELVEPSVKPGPGQIRNGNGPMLLAQVSRAHGVARFLGIAKDEPGHLRERVAEGLQADILLLSGGVSAGKFDLVPGTLAELGVETRFHKVAMKPGKPLLFGTKPRDESAIRGGVSTLVFGLPGNPVASLLCFELFVRPAMRRLMGLPADSRWVKATLTQDRAYRTDRPTYHPARLTRTETGWTVEATRWFGSPDLRGVLPANAFVLLPVGDHRHRAGQLMNVLCVDEGD